MTSFRIVVIGGGSEAEMARTRVSCAWADHLDVLDPAAALPVCDAWTLVLRPGETLAADAPAVLERQLTASADRAIALRILTTLCGSACVSDFFAPAPEVRLLRSPAVWQGAGPSHAPVLENIWIHRDLGDSPDGAATQLPVETRAEFAIARALEVWRQRERPGCSTAERRALALYAWRLLVEADRSDGERLSALLTLPVIAQTRM